jgi:hypothetical protein
MTMHLLRAAFFAVAALGLAGTAAAVDVENADQKEYTVTLTESGGKTTVKLGPGETKMDLCAVCSVAIEGAQPVNGSGLDKVIIQDGKLSRVDG